MEQFTKKVSQSFVNLGNGPYRAFGVMLKSLHRVLEDNLFFSVPVDHKWHIDFWASVLMMIPQEVLGVILDLWPWGCGSYKAISLVDFCLWSHSRVSSKLSGIVTSLVRLVKDQTLFCESFLAEDLKHHPWVLPSCLLNSFFGCPQVLPHVCKLVKVWQPRVIGPNNSSNFSKTFGFPF